MLWDKNVVFSPENQRESRISSPDRPGIQIVSVKNLADLTQKFWENYFLKLHGPYSHRPCYLPTNQAYWSGCPPIELIWMVVDLPGAEENCQGNSKYSACASTLLRS